MTTSTVRMDEAWSASRPAEAGEAARQNADGRRKSGS